LDCNGWGWGVEKKGGRGIQIFTKDTRGFKEKGKKKEKSHSTLKSEH